MKVNGKWDFRMPGLVPRKKVAVPSNWFLEGINAYGRAVYERRINIEAGKFHVIYFEGVDYIAKVRWNGKLLGSHAGYFESFLIPVPARLVRGSNLLRVEVDAPYEKCPQTWPGRKTTLKGVFQHHDARPGGAFAAALRNGRVSKKDFPKTWTEDGQDRGTGGIWGEVHIFEVEKKPLGAFDHIEIKPKIPVSRSRRSNRFLVRAEISVYGEIAPSQLVISRGQTKYNLRELRRRRGRSSVKIYYSGEVSNPELWWPWDLGNQPLYRLSVETEAGTLKFLHNKEIGFRSVRGDGFFFEINGERYPVRGTNIIPTQWISGLDEATVRKDLDLVKKANMNSLRVHAHVTHPRFYSAADKAGVLLWQDFPLQWSYEDTTSFQNEARRQLGAMIRKLSSHPSIFAWCCHNESPAAEEMDWLKLAPPDRNRRLDKILYQEARKLDKTRYVHKNSGEKDGHPYPGWYYGRIEDMRHYNASQFITEYGAQALPASDTIQKFSSNGSRLKFPISSEKIRKTWEYHDFQPEETLINLGDYNSLSLEQFIRRSQSYQAALISWQTVELRKRPYAKMRGLFHFMFVEPWESITWAVVDHLRKPKPGYAALSQSMAPVLVALLPVKVAVLPGDRISCEIVFVNDLQTKISVQYKLVLPSGWRASLAGRKTLAPLSRASTNLLTLHFEKANRSGRVPVIRYQYREFGKLVVREFKVPFLF